MFISVQGRDPNRCGVFLKKCENDQYCWRVIEKNPPVEYCVAFRKEGELCDDAGKVCYPGLYCQYVTAVVVMVKDSWLAFHEIELDRGKSKTKSPRWHGLEFWYRELTDQISSSSIIHGYGL
ncbi:hypothetical protein TNCV_4049361 [Trichonephila clavipes]|nr:hypothetical protein TNCV_4049361 [Trichonephila clavipes]